MKCTFECRSAAAQREPQLDSEPRKRSSAARYGAMICVIFAANAAVAVDPDPIEIVRLLKRQDATLLRVGERLTVGGGRFCDSGGYSPGMAVQLLGQYRPDLRPAARGELGLTNHPTVTLIASGGAAETAGVREGDVIRAIDGQSFAEDDSSKGASFKALAAVHDRIEAAFADGKATLDIVRDGTQRHITVTARKACRVRFDVRAGETSRLFGRFADAGDSYVRVRSELVSQTKDDGELAAIMAHEMAHVILGHSRERSVKRQRLSVRERELQADRLSVYLMDAAGFSPLDAVSFWGRWGPANDPGPLSGYPGWKVRLSAIQAEIANIVAMKAAGKPLQAPNDLHPPR